MSGPVHAFDYLSEPGKHRAAAITVLFGDEWLLRKLVLDQLQDVLFGAEDIPVASLDGQTAEWRDARDELCSASLFGGGKPRLVIIHDADTFISEHRKQLEDYVAKPVTRNVLLLMAKTFAANTRLYKEVIQAHLAIDCRPPEIARGRSKSLDTKRIVQWMVENADRRHSARLPSMSAELLLDLVGPDFGRLDSETEKLALYVGGQEKITPELVRDLVGGWRAQSTWDMIDAALEGQAAAALDHFARLLQAGDEPIGILAQMAWALRQYAAATRVIQRSEQAGRKWSLEGALLEAGVKPFGDNLAKGVRRLRQIGRVRGSHLYQWVLDADLAMKLTHSSTDRSRWMLEQLILRLARQAAPARAEASA